MVTFFLKKNLCAKKQTNKRNAHERFTELPVAHQILPQANMFTVRFFFFFLDRLGHSGVHGGRCCRNRSPDRANAGYPDDGRTAGITRTLSREIAGTADVGGGAVLLRLVGVRVKVPSITAASAEQTQRRPETRSHANN